MRQTGRVDARFARLARGTAICLLAVANWAGGLADPAISPPGRPGVARQSVGLHQELTLALAERRAQFQAVAASRSDAGPPSAPPVVWPATGELTGWFGEQRGGHRHPGIDVDGETGDPVVAAAAGKVSHAGPSPAGYAGYGTVVIIAHGEGLTTIYAHLSGLAVSSGHEVGVGQRVGSMGTTGNVTGSHLHFELRRGGIAIDPRPWLPAR